MDKLFTLEEANQALPLVRAITIDAVECYRAAKLAIADLDDRDATADRDVHEQAVASRLERLRALLDELEELGCRLRDYERGIVDFPADFLGEHGFAVYCWALGEDEVLHWHEDHEGYLERRPVSAAAAR